MGDRGYLRFLIAAACATTLEACGRVPLCPEVTFDQEIAVPATSTTTKSLVERISAHTVPGPAGVTVSIVDGQGTIAFEGRGPISAFIYGREPFQAAQRILYLGLGIEDGTWFPFWLYCADDGRLTEFYGEMTDRDVGVLETVEGTCSPTADFREMPIEIPAHSLRHVALTCGFSATSTPAADRIDLHGSRAGRMDLAGIPSTVLPFHAVDCRTTCGPRGWYELHAIVWDPVAQTVGFTIFYLDNYRGVRVNGFLLPSASPLTSPFPNTVWTLDR